jgi:DNA-binding transcriptional regulator LsrR (DeoR family)
MIGITGEQLRAVPEVVAVAGGADKANAIDVALRAGFITSLITNTTVAAQLLNATDPAERATGGTDG